MDYIISLSELITRQKIHQAALVDELDFNENKMSQLYNNVLLGKIKNDQDAISILYNGRDQMGSLKKLKQRLYHRLINSVFFIDQSGSNYKDIFEAAKTCYKHFAAAKLLIGNQKNKVGIDIVEKTIKMSMKYEFTDLNYLFSSLLANYYVLSDTHKKKYEKYIALQDYYLLAISGENYIERLYRTLGIKLSKSSSGLSDEDFSYYKKELNVVIEKQKEIKTTKFNLNAYLFQANLYLELKEYPKIIEIVEAGLNFYREKDIKSTAADYSLQTRAAIAYFLMKDYHKAEQIYEQNLSITSPQSSNWFATYNHYFAIKIIQNQFSEAYNILSKVINSNEFDKTHPLLVQLFRIKEAYIHFLIELGKIDPSQSEEKPIRKFKLSRFLNDTPTYSQDKRGANISILIIQMLLLVQNKQHIKIIDKLDALNMYSHRYLRSDNTFRSNCFIKMLAKLPDADYNPIRWERYVKKFRDKLNDHPFELSYHNLDLEVIPFETLYDLVVEMLGQK